MRKNIKHIINSIVGALALAILCMSAHATVTVLQFYNLGTNGWPTNSAGLTNSINTGGNAPLTATFFGNGAGFTSAQGGNAVSSLGQIIVVGGTGPATVSALQILADGAANADQGYPDAGKVPTGTGVGTNLFLNLYDMGAATNFGGAAFTNPPSYSALIGANMLGGGSGLSLTVAAQTNDSILEIDLSGADIITLTNGHMYVFELSGTSGTYPIGWRFSPTFTYRPGNAYISQGGLPGGYISGSAGKEFALALFGNNLVNPTFPISSVTIARNPDLASYGPPSRYQFAAQGGVAITDTSYVDQGFSGTEIMGETFQYTQTHPIDNIFFACSGTTNTGNYQLYLYDLGTTAPGSSFALGTNANVLDAKGGPFQLATNIFLTTNKYVMKIRLAFVNQPILTNGHYYFFGLSYLGNGSNDLVLELTGSGQTYANGAAYRGPDAVSSSLTNNGFSGVRNFAMAFNAPPPRNFGIATISTNVLTDTWPSVFGNLPVMQTYNTPASTVPATSEGTGSGQGLSQAFVCTNDFYLGGFALRGNGRGSSNCFFTLNLYMITNTFLTSTQADYNTANKWPLNFQPGLDARPLGTCVWQTNVNFLYNTNNSAAGADYFFVLSITNPAYQVLLHSNNIYVVEMVSDTIGANFNNNPWNWARGSGPQATFQTDWIHTGGLPDLATNMVGATGNVQPRGYKRSTTDVELIGGPLSGSIREYWLSIYGAPPPAIRAGNITRSGNDVTFSWNATRSSTYAVLKKNALTDASWTTLTNNYPTGLGAASDTVSFTDTTASGSMGFYRIVTPSP
jgi:hypothetical protein